MRHTERTYVITTHNYSFNVLQPLKRSRVKYPVRGHILRISLSESVEMDSLVALNWGVTLYIASTSFCVGPHLLEWPVMCFSSIRVNLWDLSNNRHSTLQLYFHITGSYIRYYRFMIDDTSRTVVKLSFI